MSRLSNQKSQHWGGRSKIASLAQKTKRWMEGHSGAGKKAGENIAAWVTPVASVWLSSPRTTLQACYCLPSHPWALLGASSVDRKAIANVVCSSGALRLRELSLIYWVRPCLVVVFCLRVQLKLLTWLITLPFSQTLASSFPFI